MATATAVTLAPPAFSVPEVPTAYHLQVSFIFRGGRNCHER